MPLYKHCLKSLKISVICVPKSEKSAQISLKSLKISVICVPKSEKSAQISLKSLKISVICVLKSGKDRVKKNDTHVVKNIINIYYLC